MSRIFISYKRVDKEKVFKIKDQIESALGEKCWIDLDGIESDAQFKNVIIKAINQCEIVLFMYSKTHSKIKDFEKDWTVRELNFAQKKGKRIVFINIDGSSLTDAFEFDYGTKQQVDGNSHLAIEKLCKDIIFWLKKGETETELMSRTSEFHTMSTDSTLMQITYSSKVKEWTSKVKKTVLYVFVIFVGFFSILLIIGLIEEYTEEKKVKESISSPYVYIDNTKEVPEDSIKIKWPKDIERKYEETLIRSIYGNMRKVESENGDKFFISSQPVNEQLWGFAMNDSYYTQDLDKVKTGVSWNECEIFCEYLTQKLGTNFSLPTEEEWKEAIIKNKTITYNPLMSNAEYCYDWVTDGNGNQMTQKVVCGFDMENENRSSHLRYKPSSIAPSDKSDSISFRLVLRK